MTEPTVRVLPDAERLAHAAAQYVAAAVERAARPGAALALSGGSTPRRLYELLGERSRAGGPWDAVDLYWADDRWVVPTDPASNVHLLEATWFRLHRPPAERIHPVPTGARDPAASAAAYDAQLRQRFAGHATTYRVAILGIGPDGHTASLFPGLAAVDEAERWAVEVPEAPIAPRLPRVTQTLGPINRCERAIVLASGAAKAAVVRAALDPAVPAAARLPAGRVRGREETVWFLDADAARELPASRATRSG